MCRRLYDSSTSFHIQFAFHLRLYIVYLFEGMQQILHNGELVAFDGVFQKIEAIGTKENLIECKAMFAFKAQIQCCCTMFQDFGPTRSSQNGAWTKYGGFISSCV